MKIAIMQPYFFPYLGYFQLMNAVDKFVILDDVNYKKNGWINRNNIIYEGRKRMFSVPVKSVSQNKHINEMEIYEEDRWKENFFKMLDHSYKKAPFFPAVYTLVESIITAEIKNLSDYIRNSLAELRNFLKIKTQIVNSSTIYNNKELKGQARIIDICKRESAREYVNAIGGQELYSKEDFERNGLKLHFLKSSETNYKQFDNEFITDLSIIDILMFNDVERIGEFLENYELV